ncbi:MAG: hypothetical protein WBW33_31530, partial [Bryobacteraceae bacterium]
AHPALASTAASWNRPVPRPQIRWKYAIGGAVVSLAVMAAAGWWLTRPFPSPRVSGTNEVTHDGLTKWWPILADGSRLIYSAGANGGGTYQVSAKGGESVAVPLQITGRLIGMSPDGAQLLLAAHESGNLHVNTLSELWVKPLLGGEPPRRLGNLFVTNGAASWSPDGQQLVYAINNDLHIARSDGTEIRKLVTAPAPPHFPRWSPDGKRIRFFLREKESSPKKSLWEVSVESGALRSLLRDWQPSLSVYCGNWSPDGRYFVFEVTGHGTSNIWALAEPMGLHRAAAAPFQITTGPMAAYIPVFSPDGKHMFMDGVLDKREFLRYDLQSGQLTPDLSGISGSELEYSKDGKWVAYVSIPDRSLWRAAADGSQRLQLTVSPMSASMPHWSPDGKEIAFFGGPPDAPPRIYVVPSESGEVRQLTHGEAGASGDAYFAWSPDGASIVFGGSGPTLKGVLCYRCADSDRTPLHRLDVKMGTVSTLPGSEQMFSPHWSPDGRFITGLAGPNSKLTLYDVATRKQTEISGDQSGWPAWSRDGESLFFHGSKPEAAWWRFRLSDRTVERVASLKEIPVATDGWFAPGLNNSLITTRSVGTDEIYALDWEAP